MQIEGITPDMLWTFIGVLVALAGVFVLGHKVVEILRKEHERKELKQQPTEKLADELSQKVIEKLEPRFAKIDDKLSIDKARLDEHTRRISELENRAGRSETGIKALCRGMLALLNHAEDHGNGKEINDAKKNFTDYLADK